MAQTKRKNDVRVTKNWEDKIWITEKKNRDELNRVNRKVDETAIIIFHFGCTENLTLSTWYKKTLS